MSRKAPNPPPEGMKRPAPPPSPPRAAIMTALPSPHSDALDDLDDLIKQLQCGSYIGARERNPFAGPMTLIEPGVASKAAAALVQLRDSEALARGKIAEQMIEIARLRAGEEKLRYLLIELVAQVRGECPSLLDEDSGGDARLSMAIDAAIDAARSKP